MFNIIGQEKIRQDLIHRVRQKCLPQTNLFYGAVGVGKALVAREVAAAVLCENQRLAPCGDCSSCQQMLDGIHPDFVEVRPGKPISKSAASSATDAETSSSGAAETLRRESIDAMKQSMSRFPLLGQYQVAVIVDAHLMSDAAANTLLKILEEPRPHQIFILVTSRLHQILLTIRSRSAKRYFPPVAAANASVEISVDVAAVAGKILTRGSFADAVEMAKKITTDEIDMRLLFQYLRCHILQQVKDRRVESAPAIVALRRIQDAEFHMERRVRKEFVLENLFV